MGEVIRRITGRSLGTFFAEEVAGGGWGGSMVIVDLDDRMTIAYTMNKMEAGIVGGMRSEALLKSAYSAVAAR